MNPKPHRPTTLAPMLNVRNGKSALAFYQAAFSARVLYRFDDVASDHIVVQLSVAGAEFWIADESPPHKNFSPESLSGCSVRLILTVDDPDAVVAQAVSAGASVFWPVGEEHGWRIGRIIDPFGHHWEVGKPLS